MAVLERHPSDDHLAAYALRPKGRRVRARGDETSRPGWAPQVIAHLRSRCDTCQAKVNRYRALDALLQKAEPMPDPPAAWMREAETQFESKRGAATRAHPPGGGARELAKRGLRAAQGALEVLRGVLISDTRDAPALVGLRGGPTPEARLLVFDWKIARLHLQLSATNHERIELHGLFQPAAGQPSPAQARFLLIREGRAQVRRLTGSGEFSLRITSGGAAGIAVEWAGRRLETGPVSI